MEKSKLLEYNKVVEWSKILLHAPDITSLVDGFKAILFQNFSDWKFGFFIRNNTNFSFKSVFNYNTDVRDTKIITEIFENLYNNGYANIVSEELVKFLYAHKSVGKIFSADGFILNINVVNFDTNNLGILLFSGPADLFIAQKEEINFLCYFLQSANKIKQDKFQGQNIISAKSESIFLFCDADFKFLSDSESVSKLLAHVYSSKSIVVNFLDLIEESYINYLKSKLLGISPDNPKETLYVPFVSDVRNEIIWEPVKIYVFFNEDTTIKEYQIEVNSNANIINENRKIVDDLSRTVQINEDLLVYKEELEASLESINRANLNLAERESYLNSIINGAAECIITLDEKKNIVTFNKAAINTFGYLRDQIVSLNLLFLIERQYQPRVRDFLYKRYAPNGNDNYLNQKVKLVKKGGTKFWGLLRINKIKIGDSLKFVVIVTDLSEVTLIENQLKKEEERYRLLAENTSDILSLVDQSFKFIFVSPSCYSVTGFHSDDFINNSIFEFVSPDEKGVLQKEVERNISIQSSQGRYIYRHIHKLGHYIWIEAQHNYTYYTDGALNRITINLREITRRIEMENKLAEREYHYKLLAENTTDLILLTDSNGLLTYVSPSIKSLTGWSAEEIFGQHVLELFEDNTKYFTDLKHAFNNLSISKQPLKGVSCLKTKDSGSLYVKVNFIKINHSDTYSFQLTVNDINNLIIKQQELENEENKFKSLINQSLFGIALNNKNGHFIYVNQKFAEIFGYTTDELIGQHYSFLARNEHDATATGDLFSKYLKEGEVLPPTEFYSLTKSGEEIFVRTTAKPITYGKDNLIFAIYTQDITELKNTTQRLEDINNILRYHKEALDNSMIVSVTDAQGDITYVNKKFLDATGYKEEELLGQNHRMLNSGYHSNEFFQQLWSQISKGILWRNEVLNRRKDGELVWWDSVIVPFKEQPEQKGFHYFSIRVEITDRKKAEEKLGRLVETLEDNQEALKYNAIELQKRNDELNIIKGELEEALAREREAKEELSVAIEELSQAQSQLVHSEKMAGLGQLTSGIAHEINNPINFVFAGVNALEMNLKNLDKIVSLTKQLPNIDTLEHLNDFKKTFNDLRERYETEIVWEDILLLTADIRNGAERTAQIVKALKDFSKLDQADFKSSDIHQGIESTIIILNRRFLEKDINVVKHFDRSIGLIDCFPGQLNQAFLAILNNAIEAIGQQGQIEILTENFDESVEIRFIDSGPGLPKKLHSQVFEPFYTTKQVGQGTGLGLSICHQVVQLHKGQIYFEERAPGAEIVIKLPK